MYKLSYVVGEGNLLYYNRITSAKFFSLPAVLYLFLMSYRG